VSGVGKLESVIAGGRLLVKICGITTREDARLAVDAGADAVGFVFWFMSPRKVDPARAAAIVRELPAPVLRVGVFVDAPRDEMLRICDEVGLDLLQLHGEEPLEALVDPPRPALKAVRVGRPFAPEEALRYASRAAGVVVDTRLPGETQLPGGTGVPFDWSLAAASVASVPDAGGRPSAGERGPREGASARMRSTSSGVSACQGARTSRA
jgi:phosphoribosylanthranilate isomerase